MRPAQASVQHSVDKQQNDKRRQRADMLVEAGLVSEAVCVYEQVAESDNDNAEVQQVLADAYWLAERTEEAIGTYRETTRRHPRHTAAHFGLSELLLHSGQPRAAITALEKAVQCQSNRAYYLYRLSQLYLLVNKFPEAESLLQRAVGLEPDDGFYHFKLGDLYFGREQWAAASEEYEAAVACSPVDDFYHLRLAATYVRQGRDEQALAMFQRTVLICPDNCAYQYLLADHLEQMARCEEAAYHYQQAGELGPYDRDYVERVKHRCGTGGD